MKTDHPALLGMAVSLIGAAMVLLIDFVIAPLCFDNLRWWMRVWNDGSASHINVYGWAVDAIIIASAAVGFLFASLVWTLNDRIEEG